MVNNPLIRPSFLGEWHYEVPSYDITTSLKESHPSKCYIGMYKLKMRWFGNGNSFHHMVISGIQGLNF